MISMALRHFILPALAVIVVGTLPVPADAGRSAVVASGCGPTLTTDPVLRTSFKDFERTQSPAAAKVCAIYANTVGTSR